MSDERIVEVIASARWKIDYGQRSRDEVGNGEEWSRYTVPEARKVLAALRDAGFDVYRPDEHPGDQLIRRLFETTTDYYGNEVNHAWDDLASELRDRWLAKRGADIEESLNIRMADVHAVCQIAADVMRDWCLVPVGGDS